uniref:Uncharacterized protein n=1 Tax=Arundo donax TaxID=35708 RepID=A0A0A9FPI8_ARUDO
MYPAATKGTSKEDEIFSRLVGVRWLDSGRRNQPMPRAREVSQERDGNL